MAISKKQIKDTYPLPAYNYQVRIGSEAIGFSQASGLNIQYETIPYRHGMSWKEGENEVLGLEQAVTLTLQRGIVARGSKLLEWITKCRNKGLVKQDIFIDLCDEEGTPIITWTAIDAFPTSLTEPSFDAGTNDIAIESLELKAWKLNITYHQAE